MPSDAAIQKSLKHRKWLLQEFRLLAPLEFFDWFDVAREAILAAHLHCDFKSVKAAAEYFELDLTYQPHREMLLSLLAHAVFGKHKRGVKRNNGTAWWSIEQMRNLGIGDREIRREKSRTQGECKNRSKIARNW